MFYFIISYNHPAENETKLKRLLFADGHEVTDVDNTKNQDSQSVTNNIFALQYYNDDVILFLWFLLGNVMS